MHERALKCCEKSLKIQPENVKSLLLKAKVLKILEKYEEALECEKIAKRFQTQNSRRLITKICENKYFIDNIPKFINDIQKRRVR